MSWWRRRGEPKSAHGAPVDPVDRTKDLAALTQIARAHLEPELAERWLRLVRPAIRLLANDSTGPRVARIGGRPLVPPNFEWPVWEDVGPLSYVGEIDLELLAAQGLDPGIDLPKTGRLLAFYFDGSYDDFASIVGTWDRDSLKGARLLHVSTPQTQNVEVSAPNGVLEFREQWLHAWQIMTHPGWEHPVLRQEFGKAEWNFQTWRQHPVQAEAFNESLWALEGNGPRHQIGGWADPVQGPVELEVAQAALLEPFEYGDAVHVAEGLAWRPLLQIDSDDASEMMWGDVGMLYWLRRDPEADDELGDVSFTWQCG